LWNSDTEADDYNEYCDRLDRVEEAEEDSRNEKVTEAEQTGSETRENDSNIPTSVRHATAGVQEN